MALTKIVKLTPTQEIEFVAHREAWRAIGSRTGHDPECETVGYAAVVDAYKEIGVEPPTLVLWAQSPLQALLMHWSMRGILTKAPAVPATIDLAKSGSLRGQLRGQLRDQQLEIQLGGQLGDQLRGQLRGQLWGQLGDQLRDQFEDQLQEAYNQTWCWGQCECYWTAWARFAILIGVKATDEQERRLQIMERLARSAFMVLSWSGVTILVQHPSVASFDASHRLHRTDGPALAWPDGYAVYAINGIRLTPDRGTAMVAGTLTAAEIRDEPNAEVRRVLVATYNSGDTGRYLRDVGATVIHADVDLLGLPRRLLRIDQEGDEPFIGIEVTNSTPEPDGTRKLYTFRCDPELRTLPIRGICDDYGAPQELTCQNAIASTYGYLGSEYRPVIET